MDHPIGGLSYSLMDPFKGGPSYLAFSLMVVMNQSGGPPWVDQKVGHRWARLTGWPVTMVAGGPVELGALQPYVY